MTVDAFVAELERRLHPPDHREIPVPGFPAGKEFVEWARGWPLDTIVPALRATLAYDTFPQQYMAMSTLRQLGFDISGVDEGDGYVWIIESNGEWGAERIVPRYRQ